MPNLRVHVKDDPQVLGGISQANLELIADVLDWVGKLRFLSPFRKHAQALRLLGATFARVKGIPEPLPDRAPIIPIVVEVPAERVDLPSHEDFLKARGMA